MDRETLLKRLKFRATHRGTKEADLVVGGYFDTFSTGWDSAQIAWFEAFMDEQDADIIGWVTGVLPVPDRLHGAMMDALLRLEYVGGGQ